MLNTVFETHPKYNTPTTATAAAAAAAAAPVIERQFEATCIGSDPRVSAPCPTALATLLILVLQPIFNLPGSVLIFFFKVENRGTQPSSKRKLPVALPATVVELVALFIRRQAALAREIT